MKSFQQRRLCSSCAGRSVRLSAVVATFFLPACQSGGTPVSPDATVAPGDTLSSSAEQVVRRIVLVDDAGRHRIVLDANEGIRMYDAKGELVIVLIEDKDQVFIKCGRGALEDTPDGPIWNPGHQIVVGAVGGFGFVKVSSNRGYSRLSAQEGVQTERL